MTTLTILILSDDQTLSEQYANWIDTDYSVYTSPTTEIDEKPTDEVDLILLYQNIPEVTDELIQTIQNQTRGAPIVLITDTDPDFDVGDSAFSNILPTPVSESDIKTVIDTTESVIEIERLLQESYNYSTQLAALETSKSQAELRENERYFELVEEHTAVKSQLEAELAETNIRQLYNLLPHHETSFELP